MTSLFKTNTPGNRVKWELPSPVASSSPIVAKWQSLRRREYKSAAASSGAPGVTVIEEEDRTRIGALTSAGTATERAGRGGLGTEGEVVIQAEEGTLVAAEGGAGAENGTALVAIAKIDAGAETRSGFQEVIEIDMENLAKLNLPPSRKVDFKTPDKNNLGDAFLPGECDGTKSKRCISLTPMRVLDAPGLKDDYYLNLVDWNAANLVAIALSNAVYLWHPEKGVQQTINLESGFISSVAWIKDRNNLAIGTSAADVQLWDVETTKKLRNMHSHNSMVGALSWNDYILSSGSRFGTIHHHDVRIARHHVGTLCGHNSQVCSLKWSPDGGLLASGGNDGRLNIWLNDPGANINSKADVTINNQQSAVKAMNWCPWQSGILAVGGGMKDGHLRIWDTKSGSCIQDVDTKSQICSLLWLSQYKELVTGHGFPKYQVSVWNYPSLMKSADLKGHRGRVLHLALSPDGNIVFSAAADETVCLWSCLTASEQTLDVKHTLYQS
ncbi:cell division cycle protein 20 homolog [Mustelus asterias]